MSTDKATDYRSASGRVVRLSTILVIALICSAFVTNVRGTEETEVVEKVGCTADLNGYFFNLKPLSMPIDP